MSEVKWYEEVGIGFYFTPFRWRLGLDVQPYWGYCSLLVGPFDVTITHPHVGP